MNGSDYRAVAGLKVETDGPVLRLRIDRPDRRNAIDDTVMDGLVAAFDTAGRDDAVRVVHLSGTGDHFCGGADIVARNAGTKDRPRPGAIQRRLPAQAHRLVPLILTVQVPVVCGIRGWAAGIGFQLALASDFTVATEDAQFWEPFSTRGFTPDSGATWLLPRIAGPTRARELLMLGRRLSGAEAADWGLIHRAVPGDDLDSSVEDLIGGLAAGPTVSLGLTKWLLNTGAGRPLDEHLPNEAFALELSSRSRDFREGLQAFQERRAPDFEGR